MLSTLHAGIVVDTTRVSSNEERILNPDIVYNYMFLSDKYMVISVVDCVSP